MSKGKATTKTEESQNAPLRYEVNIYPNQREGAQKAAATVNINGQFAIRGVKIIEGSKGLFVSLPGFRSGNGEYKDICFPCTKEARGHFDQVVMNAYEQKMAENQSVVPKEGETQVQSQPAMATM